MVEPCRAQRPCSTARHPRGPQPLPGLSPQELSKTRQVLPHPARFLWMRSADSSLQSSPLVSCTFCYVWRPGYNSTCKCLTAFTRTPTQQWGNPLHLALSWELPCSARRQMPSRAGCTPLATPAKSSFLVLNARAWIPFPHLLVVWPWVRYLISLRHSFLFSNRGNVVPPSQSCGLTRYISMCKFLEQCSKPSISVSYCD